MALCSKTPFLFLTTDDLHCFSPAKIGHCFSPAKRGIRNANRKVLSLKNESIDEKPTKFITFIGKGGSGKTTASIFAAQHYAMSGLNTCLVIHSQDPSAEFLLNCKIGPFPSKCNENLSVVRLETTKMMLEPLKKLKQADARLNLTQGVIEGVVGEELGVLPGMDTIFSALELERLVGFFGNVNAGKFDIVIYDGVSTEETIRMIGAVGKARLYMKYLRQLAEKTDLGRVAGPSIFRLVDESMSLSSRGININGKTSSEIWDYLERIIEKRSSVFADPQKFGCYIVMDPTNPLSMHSASRYWGCAIQAGIELSGAFGINVPDSPVMLLENIKNNFSPLPSASIPYFRFDNHLNWNEILVCKNSRDARDMLSATIRESVLSSVKFDSSSKSVTLFMPGFDKSEIKLYQFRGGSELLVEAGDQRRIIRLPSKIQGKVSGAKFADRSLMITMR